MTDGKALARKRQALVTVDKIEEAIDAEDYADARDAVARLNGHLVDLEGMDGE